MVLNIWILTHSFCIEICVMNDKKNNQNRMLQTFSLVWINSRFFCAWIHLFYKEFFYTKRGNILHVQNIKVNGVQRFRATRETWRNLLFFYWQPKLKPKKYKSDERSRWLHSVEYLLWSAQQWVGKFKNYQKK